MAREISFKDKVKYTFDEITPLVKKIIQASLKHPTDRICMNFVGVAGIGKTQFISSLAKDLDMNYEKITLTNYDETTPLMGYPTKVYPMKDVNGNIREVEVELVDIFLKRGFEFTSLTPKGTYSIPDRMKRINAHARKGKASILHIDEYNRAFPFIKQAVMELINSGEYGDYVLDNCVIVLTSNPSTGDYTIVSTDDKAHRGRYWEIPVRFDAKSWMKWAEGANIQDEAIKFIYDVPEATDEDKGIDIRQWTKFFRSIEGIPLDDKGLEVISGLGNISIGDHTNTYITFINNNLDSIPSLADIFNLARPDREVISELKDSLRDKDTNEIRIDLAAFIGLRIKNYVRTRKDISNEFVDRLGALIGTKIFPTDTMMLLVTDFYKDHPHGTKLQRLNRTKEVHDAILL